MEALIQDIRCSGFVKSVLTSSQVTHHNLKAALLETISVGYFDLAKYMIEHYLLTYAQCMPDGLSTAAQHGWLDIVKYLLNYFAAEISGMPKEACIHALSLCLTNCQTESFELLMDTFRIEATQADTAALFCAAVCSGKMWVLTHLSATFPSPLGTHSDVVLKLLFKNDAVDMLKYLHEHGHIKSSDITKKQCREFWKCSLAMAKCLCEEIKISGRAELALYNCNWGGYYPAYNYLSNRRNKECLLC